MRQANFKELRMVLTIKNRIKVIKKLAFFAIVTLVISGCVNDRSKLTHEKSQNFDMNKIVKAKVQLAHGMDESAGGVEAYIISTTNATYYLEKKRWWFIKYAR